MSIVLEPIVVPKTGRAEIGFTTEDAFGYMSSRSRGLFAAAVADGHGDSADNALTKALAQAVVRRLLETARVDPIASCHALQAELSSVFAPTHSGVVATRLMLTNDHWSVVSVGDTRAYRFDPTVPEGFQLLTRDHTLRNVHERSRLRSIVFPEAKDSDTFFYPMGSSNPDKLARVCVSNLRGGKEIRLLQVTRSFGDVDFRPFVIPDPDVFYGHLQSSRPIVFALCSDGGVAVLERAFGYAKMHGSKTVGEIAEFARLCLPNVLSDDLTILLVGFQS